MQCAGRRRLVEGPLFSSAPTRSRDQGSVAEALGPVANGMRGDWGRVVALGTHCLVICPALREGKVVCGT